MHSTQRCIHSALGAALLLGAATQTWAQTATINLGTQKQTIRGFGGMNHPVWAGDLTAAQRTTAFGNDEGQLGFTILRVWVSDNKNDWSKEVATAKRAIELGAIAFASPWNPPSSMKSSGSIVTSQFAAYADHLNGFVSYMKDQGVNLYAIGVQNEPDYANDWTKWTQDQVHDFILNFGGKITTKLITAESFNYQKSFYDKILNDSAALANVAIVGTHLYGTALNAFPYPLFDQKGAGKERWMTEHYTDSKNDADLWPMALDVAFEMHNAMVEGQFNAYVWWYIRRSYGPMKENGQISKRGYCMAQFSKFIRPGFVRVDATKNPTTDVYLSAYKGDKDVVIVAVNRSSSSKSVTLSISNSTISSFDRFTTSSSKSLTKEAAVSASNGSFSITLDGQSVTTLHTAAEVLGGGGSAGTGGASSASTTPTAGGATGASSTRAAGGATGIVSSAKAAGGVTSSGTSIGVGGGSTSSARSRNSGGGTGRSAGDSNQVGGSNQATSDAITRGGDSVGQTMSSAGGSLAASSRNTGPGADAGGALTTDALTSGTSEEQTEKDGGCTCRIASKGTNSRSLALVGLLSALVFGSMRRCAVSAARRLHTRQ